MKTFTTAQLSKAATKALGFEVKIVRYRGRGFSGFGYVVTPDSDAWFSSALDCAISSYTPETFTREIEERHGDWMAFDLDRPTPPPKSDAAPRVARRSMYAATIADLLRARRRTDIPPACIEGWMRLQYGTLDHLDAATFVEEVMIAIHCHDEAGVERSTNNARSYGLC